MTVSHQAIVDALRTVEDPELHQDLISLGMIKGVELDEESAVVRVIVELTTPACPMKERIRQDVCNAVGVIPGVARVDVELMAKDPEAKKQPAASLPGVKHVIAIGSGKGGVGKSTVAANVACALARTGAKVGLLDADIYGPSAGILFGVDLEEFARFSEGVPEEALPEGKRLPPYEKHGLKILSMGFLVPTNQALAWRGPMTHMALKQLFEEVHWGELDYLIVDLPPGTGDAVISATQLVALAGAVVVCTPQDLALADAQKAISLFLSTGTPVLGIIENMSYFCCPACNAREEIFGCGGVRKTAMERGIAFLGELPLATAVRRSGDDGVPIVIADPESESAKAFCEIAAALAGIVSRRVARPAPQAPPAPAGCGPSCGGSCGS